VQYEKQKLFGRAAPDAFIPDVSLAIFVDGEYWHRLDEVIQKDIRVTDKLRRGGLDVIRLDTYRNKVDFFPLVEYLIESRYLVK